MIDVMCEYIKANQNKDGITDFVRAFFYDEFEVVIYCEADVFTTFGTHRIKNDDIMYLKVGDLILVNDTDKLWLRTKKNPVMEELT